MSNDKDTIEMQLPQHQPSMEAHGSDYILELQVPAQLHEQGNFQRNLAKWLSNEYPQVKLLP